MLLPVKHITLLALCLLLLFKPAMSQTGLTAGSGVSDIVFGYGGQKSYLGYETGILVHNYPSICLQAGVSQHFMLSERLRAYTGLQFCKRGVNYSTAYLYDDLRYHLHCYYLRLPLLLKIRSRIHTEKLSGPVLGGYVSASLGSRLVMKSASGYSSAPKENIRNMDAGLLAGYCWDLGRNPGRLLLNLRLTYGLMDMMEVLDGATPYDGPDKNYARNASLELGLEFLL